MEKTIPSQMKSEPSSNGDGKKKIGVHHMVHQKEDSQPGRLRGGMHAISPYVILARHFEYALGKVFDGSAYQGDRGDSAAPPPTHETQRVIVLEEDIDIAPDFFSYFGRTATLLDSDPDLYAVSAFNDNGQALHVSDHTRLLRSDFFPGLGWMMNRDLWMEIGERWAPNGYWDDWLRDPDIRKGRQVIRPEVCRSYHFGRDGGASKNIFKKFLDNIDLNQANVLWSEIDLSYLDRQTYDANYLKQVERATPVKGMAGISVAAAEAGENVELRIEYKSQKKFTTIATMLKIMGDEKAGVPRTAYAGVVEARIKVTVFEEKKEVEKIKIYVTPPMDILRQNLSGKK